MRPVWNPVRRNKNIGTKAHGYGANNKLTILESWHETKCYFERLTSYTVITRLVGTRELRFFVEPTRHDWFYPCTIDDICLVLSHCSSEILKTFDFVVMRQPTRKQRILCPVWGRAIFAFDIDKYSGPAIVIEAQDLRPIEWQESVDPEARRERDRLLQDGHDIRGTRRGARIHVTPDSLRNTVLYRTLLHELGHHVDYNRSTEAEWGSKTQTAKEDYAHRFALELYEVLAKQGAFPFASIIDDQSLLSDGLNREWFCLP
ncbi:MAG: hypothetical protein WBO07_00465 [Formosimonas sp.]